MEKDKILKRYETALYIIGICCIFLCGIGFSLIFKIGGEMGREVVLCEIKEGEMCCCVEYNNNSTEGDVENQIEIREGNLTQDEPVDVRF